MRSQGLSTTWQKGLGPMWCLRTAEISQGAAPREARKVALSPGRQVRTFCVVQLLRRFRLGSSAGTKRLVSEVLWQ